MLRSELRVVTLSQRIIELQQELAQSRSLLASQSLSGPTIGTGLQGPYLEHLAHTENNFLGSQTPEAICDDEAIEDNLATTAFSHEPEVDIGHFGAI